MKALTAQADELIKVFGAAVEATESRHGRTSATHFEGTGNMREGSGYGFIYSKSAAGVWERDQGKDR